MMRYALFAAALAIGPMALAGDTAPIAQPLSGHYVEVRSCDVYTGACFAESERGLSGHEAILAWTIESGSWDGVAIDGLTVIAAVRANATLDDLQRNAFPAKSVVIVDERATPAQREALVALAQAQGARLTEHVVEVMALPIEAQVGTCAKNGCAAITAGNVLTVSTRCLKNGDHVCGNEESYYAPLTTVEQAMPAFAEKAAYSGNGLGVTWQHIGKRSAFLGRFTADT